MFRLVAHRLLPALITSVLGTGMFMASSTLLAQVSLQTNSARGNPSLISDNVQNKVLPIESAFPVLVFAADDTEMLVQWQITEGYYLYRKSISISLADGSTLTTLVLPDGKIINDEFFGETEVYYDTLEFRVDIADLTAEKSTIQQAEFTLHFQGCAEDRYCYPPHQMPFSIPLL